MISILSTGIMFPIFTQKIHLKQFSTDVLCFFLNSSVSSNTANANYIAKYGIPSSVLFKKCDNLFYFFAILYHFIQIKAFKLHFFFQFSLNHHLMLYIKSYERNANPNSTKTSCFIYLFNFLLLWSIAFLCKEIFLSYY